MGFEPIYDPERKIAKMLVRKYWSSSLFRDWLTSSQVLRQGISIRLTLLQLNQNSSILSYCGNWPTRRPPLLLILHFPLLASRCFITYPFHLFVFVNQAFCQASSLSTTIVVALKRVEKSREKDTGNVQRSIQLHMNTAWA